MPDFSLHSDNCQCDECREGFPMGFDSWADYYRYINAERDFVQDNYDPTDAEF
jgi:hypothetical protein